MSAPYQRLTIVGATSWGTTLAHLLANLGRDVTMLVRDEPEAAALRLRRENTRLLPGVALPLTIAFEHDPAAALRNAEFVAMVVPAQRMRENLARIAAALPAGVPVLSAAKGVELDTGLRMTEVIAAAAPGHPLLALSGPNLAPELAAGLPGSTVIACADAGVALRAQATFTSMRFRVYAASDVIGVELGGALKNIIALCCGMGDGMGHGVNGKAAFLTRGLVEIARLGEAAGADPRTFSGLAGLGDLVATCFSPLSRNRHAGEQIGRGRALADVLAGMEHVVEGVATTRAARDMARTLGVDMPITEAAYKVLFEGLAPAHALIELMTREPKYELDGLTHPPAQARPAL